MRLKMKPHTLSHYQDGFVRVAFCKVCGAEGLKLSEDCPQKIISPVDNPLDEKKKAVK